MRLLIGLGCVAVFGIITFALAAATLGTVNKSHQDLTDLINQRVAAATNKSLGAVLANSIRIEDVMSHLKQLQFAATANNETRAIHTPGFQRTIDYIKAALRNNTNYIISNNSNFLVRKFALASPPTLSLYNQSLFVRNLTYSNNLTGAEFYFVRYSGVIDSSISLKVSIIPKEGCTSVDWQSAQTSAGGSLVNRVALVQRGACTFREKALLANNYSVTAILFYNQNLAPDDAGPIEVSLSQNNTLPALFLSYSAGQTIINAALPVGSDISVRMTISLQNNLGFEPVENICADTPTGDATQTIIIGSHSDSVSAGPGINDNGIVISVSASHDYLSSRFRKWKCSESRSCHCSCSSISAIGLYQVQVSCSILLVGCRRTWSSRI